MDGKISRLAIWSLSLEVRSPRMLNFPWNYWSDQLHIVPVLDSFHIFNDQWNDHFSLMWSQDLFCPPLNVLQFVLENKVILFLFSNFVPFIKVSESSDPFFEQNIFLDFECFFLSLLGRKSVLDNSWLDTRLTFDGSNLEFLVFLLIFYQVLNQMADALPKFDLPGAFAWGKISWVNFFGIFCVCSRTSSRFYKRFSDNLCGSYWYFSNLNRALYG